MHILRKFNMKFSIIHANKYIDKEFETMAEAEAWADEFVDDQVFDSPNTLSPPLQYVDGEI